jgi:hypothetical protein
MPLAAIILAASQRHLATKRELLQENGHCKSL